MNNTTRANGRYSTNTDLVQCGSCDEVSVAEVRVDEAAGIAAVTCPECDTTQEPSHPPVDARIRVRVIALVSGVDHVTEVGPDVDFDEVEDEVLVAGNSRRENMDLVESVAHGAGGWFETGRPSVDGDLPEWVVVFGGDSA